VPSVRAAYERVRVKRGTLFDHQVPVRTYFFRLYASVF
jgi:hypothetical protein